MEEFKMVVNLYDSVADWLANYKKRTVKAATYDRLLISLRLMKKFAISWVGLTELNCDHIQRYLNELSDMAYSRSTIKKQYVLLTGYLRYAYSQGLIQSPLYMGAKLPKDICQPKEKFYYTELEQSRLSPILENSNDISCSAGLLMLLTGLRIGEVLALEWDDIYWDRRFLTVSKTLVKLSTNPNVTFVQDGAKSDSSNRSVPLNQRALGLLRKVYAKTGRCKYVFSNGDMPITYATMKYHLRKACELAQVPYTGCHIFRHTFATNCYNRGCDVKILSRLLGHADVTITYNTYIHLLEDDLEQLRAVVD